MKSCPKCNQNYSDENLNFCLNDGELLRQYDDAPPTIIMDAPRVTNQTSWQQSQYQPPPEPLAPWQTQSPMGQNQSYGVAQMVRSPDQTLPTISLVLGILSLVMICCYGGIWLGLPAAIVGFLAMRNADSDPIQYGGRGLAIGGMVLGIITFLMAIGFLILGIVSSIFN
jgi:hypothetical protein